MREYSELVKEAIENADTNERNGSAGFGDHACL